MARCEQGYLCEVCGQDVGEISESDLYLRYVLGEVPPEQLHLLPERHIRCNPALAQYIVDPAFTPVRCAGVFAKEAFDAAFVAEEEARVTRGWRRLPSDCSPSKGELGSSFSLLAPRFPGSKAHPRATAIRSWCSPGFSRRISRRGRCAGSCVAAAITCMAGAWAAISARRPT